MFISPCHTARGENRCLEAQSETRASFVITMVPEAPDTALGVIDACDMAVINIYKFWRVIKSHLDSDTSDTNISLKPLTYLVHF